VLSGLYNYSGTATDVGANGLNTLTFNDNVVGTALSTIYYFNVATAVGAASSGPRTSFQATINQSAATANLANGGFPAWVGGQLFGTAGFSEGGTRGITTIKGAVWGATISTVLRTGATNFAGNVALEIDLAVAAGASVGRNRGMQIVNESAGPRGFYADDAIAIGGTIGNTGWLHGITFTSNIDTSAFDAASSYLYAEFAHGQLVPSDTNVNWFADVQQPLFVGGLIRSRGFLVGADGTTQVGMGLVKPISTGLSVDVTGSIGTGTPTVAAGGSGWGGGDLMRDAYNGVYAVATVSGSAIATVSVLVQPSIPSGATPGNPVAVTCFGVSDGTGATLNLTWDSTQRSLSIQPTAAGKLGFNGATPIVKPTGVAVTAAGIHAALTSLGLIAP
jgi:hypothetical protein